MADSELRLRHELQSSEQARQELQDELQPKCTLSDMIASRTICIHKVTYSIYIYVYVQPYTYIKIEMRIVAFFPVVFEKNSSWWKACE